jgi:hypothetical protein
VDTDITAQYNDSGYTSRKHQRRQKSTRFAFKGCRLKLFAFLGKSTIITAKNTL